jgi:hypothetical protein
MTDDVTNIGFPLVFLEPLILPDAIPSGYIENFNRGFKNGLPFDRAVYSHY